MKIGLNATCFSDRPSGAKQRFIGLYTIIFSKMKSDTFIVYEPHDCSVGKWFDSYSNVTYIKTPFHSERKYSKYFIGLFYWPIIHKKEMFDIFETFNLPLTRGKSKLSILTIHDIRGASFEDTRIKSIFYKVVLKFSVYRADHIITVSQSMKNEISNYFPNASILVVYNGLNNENICNTSEYKIKAISKKLKLPDEFILSVGHFEPRKNHILLLKALKILNRRGIIEQLVIVGNDSGCMDLVEQEVKDLGLADYVKILTCVSDCELEVIYKKSKLFVFPSYYEGFGIPILESMHYKVPIVLSDLPVFREITENKCVYFEPSNDKSIADAMQGVILSEDKKNELIRYGSKRILDFYFHKVSKNLQELYKSKGAL
jgi:glycosyltransferase involved in cell wall biosynthesis